MLDGKRGTQELQAWWRMSTVETPPIEQENDGVIGVIIEASPAIVVLCRSERHWPIEFLSHNAERQRFFMSPSPPTKTFYLDHVHPEDRERIEHEVRACEVSGHEECALEHRLITAEGVVRWVDVRLTIRRHACGEASFYQGVLLDITARKNAELAIREREARLRALLDNTQDGIFICDTMGQILEINLAMCERLGFALDSSLTYSMRDLFTPESADALIAPLQEALRKGVVTCEAVQCFSDGKQHPVEVEARMIVYEGQRAIQGIVRDLTEIRKAGEERKKLEQQMQQAQKLESLGVLAGGIAHDFNNLLMAILGNADLALANLPPYSEARANLCDIRNTTQRAADLCKQMLAYSGKGRFHVQRVNLTELVYEMTHLLQVSVSKKAVIKFQCVENLPPVEADVTQMRQVIMNLITNASEAIGDKSGLITISTTAMHCDRAYLDGAYLNENLPEGYYVCLEVSDSGCGMDDITRNRIFEPFFTTKFMGRGLGLAAAIGIIRGHHGAIRVYSELERGTTFKILLPATQNVAQDSANTKKTNTTWRGSGAVLLVDDEEHVRDTGRRMLERLGFEVFTAEDGLKALDVFRAQNKALRCVVLDLTMPHMDGEETFREIRRMASDVPVLLSSGYNELDAMARFAGKGLAGFIQKPYDLATLSACMRAAVGE